MSRNIPRCRRWSVTYSRKIGARYFSTAYAVVWAPTRLLASLNAVQEVGHPRPGDKITISPVSLPEPF
jgi:hypothetical protein